MFSLCLRHRTALSRRNTTRLPQAAAHSHIYPPRRALSATIATTTTTTAMQPPTQPPDHPPPTPVNTPISISALLSHPTWSVRSLFPPSTSSSNDSPTTPSPLELVHLHHLCALPAPTTPSAAAALGRTLAAQLHFVRAVRRVDTAGVEPLAALRDESPEGEAELTIGLATVRDTLAAEQVRGRMRRPRRVRGAPLDAAAAEDWDVLAAAEKTVGRYFVVDIGPEEKGET